MFTKSSVHIIAGSKKVDILKQLEGVCQDAGLTLNLLAKPKKQDGKEQMEELLTTAKATADKPVVGAFVKVSSLLCIITALLFDNIVNLLAYKMDSTPLAGQSYRRLCRSLGCCFSCF